MTLIRAIIPVLIHLVVAGFALAERPKNVLLIMADDIGIECFGSYGGTSYKTPNIEKLAATGLRFTHAYSDPLCTPTRVELMTGKDNHRNWKVFGILDPEEKTFGHLMQDAGYKTCIAGKWQLQSYDPPDYPGAARRRGKGMHPKDAGFDDYSLYHSLHTEDKGSRYGNPSFLRNGELHGPLEGKYGEDLNVEFIADFMKRNREEPMFIYYPMALPHWPMNPTPISEAWKDPTRHLEESVDFFPDMVEYMDTLIGRLITHLEELGLREDTLVLFYSDNGTDRRITSKMGELSVRGGKNQVSQTGIRVPLIANWPGKVKPGTNGDLIDPSDFYPTLASLAGTKVPEGQHCDGVSFAPQLAGEKGIPRDSCFFWYDPRPGWDKGQFTRNIFALDKTHKLFADGRLMSIEGLLPTEAPVAERDAHPARARLQKVIDQMMQAPMSKAALTDPVEFGKP
jgi:arylsulfatase A-like enzyme